MACIIWVFPRPTPPYIKRGLYDFPGFLAIWVAAAFASWLLFPSTKFSKLKTGLRRLSKGGGKLGAVTLFGFGCSPPIEPTSIITLTSFFAVCASSIIFFI